MNGSPLKPIVNKIVPHIYELTKYVANTLAPLVGKIDSYTKESNHYLELIKRKRLDLEDKIMRFDVTQLFTQV